MIVLRVIFLATIVVGTCAFARDYQIEQKAEEICKKLTKHPYFDEESLVDIAWSIHYTRNMIIVENCIEMTFKRATYPVMESYREATQDYLETRVDWFRATLVANVTREMLLIPDDHGDKGRFVGVPFIFEGYGGAIGQVSLFKTAMKLFPGGRFLVMSDCLTGVSLLLVRKDHGHTQEEIQAAVANLDLGPDGHLAC